MPLLPWTLPLLLLPGCFDPIERPERPRPSGADEAVEGTPMVPSSGPPTAASEGAAPRITEIRLLPARPTVLEDVQVEAQAQDPDSPVVDLDYTWHLNGKARPDLGTATLPRGELHKGDLVRVTVEASDGTHEVEKDSAEIRIQNAPPTFTKDPTLSDRIDGLQLQAEDPDGDPLTWSLAGAPAGMTIDPTRGQIHYQGSVDEKGGAYQVVVKVEDGDGGEARWEVGLTVSPGSAWLEAQKKAAPATP